MIKLSNDYGQGSSSTADQSPSIVLKGTKSGSVSSSSSSVASEYPKRGKTRIPARLVSKEAIIDLGYTFEEEVGLSPFVRAKTNYTRVT